MINIPSYIKDPSYRYQMPALQIQVEGRGNGIRTKLLNLFQVARSLGVPPEYPLRYFGAEFGAIIEYKENEQKAMLNGSLRREDLQNSLDHFIENFVLCPKCHYPEICIRIKKNEMFSDCKACGEVRKMNMTHKICTFIMKFPPAGSKMSSQKAKPTTKAKTSKKKAKALTLKSSEITEGLKILELETELAKAAEVLNNMSVAREYDTDIKAYLMFKSILANNLLSLMSNPETIVLLRNVANGGPENFLMAFAAVYGLEEAWKERISTVLFRFMENDVLSEDVFENWKNDELDFNDASPVYNEQALAAMKANSHEFLNWLENAEVEEEEEEEKKEEVILNGHQDKENIKEEEKVEEKKLIEEVREKDKIIEKKEEKEKIIEKEEEKKNINGLKGAVESNESSKLLEKDIMSKLKEVENFSIDDI